jgi:hypothetical protein
MRNVKFIGSAGHWIGTSFVPKCAAHSCTWNKKETAEKLF